MAEETHLQRLLEEVSRREIPTPQEEAALQVMASKLEARVKENLRKLGIRGEAAVEGSVAKGTWLRSEKDVDIFILVPEDVGRVELETLYLKVARASLKGHKIRQRYAEHPYLEARTRGGLRVNIVPAYHVQPPHWKSAADRTPYHTEYVKGRLKDEGGRRETRLLKAFMRGIGVYGAELRVGGFSGYLTELLVIHYGGFLPILEASPRWGRPEIMDIAGHYGGESLEKLFDEPLILIDPVDKGRNVAAPVRAESLDIFKAASRHFLLRPSLTFFYPPTPKPPPPPQLRKILTERGTDILLLDLGRVDAVPDILWGQLHKAGRAVANELRRADFHILRSRVVSDEEGLNILLYELEQGRIGATRKHLGPPIASEGEERFLSKYLHSEDTLAGPFIEGGRWVVVLRRRETNVKALLEKRLGREGGVGMGIPSRVAKAITAGYRLMVNEEVLHLYRRSPFLATHLMRFLRGRPDWLEPMDSPKGPQA